jgi:hypothetical protein
MQSYMWVSENLQVTIDITAYLRSTTTSNAKHINSYTDGRYAHIGIYV